MEFLPNISNDDIQNLPLFSYEGEVVVVDDIAKFNQIKMELFLENIWGFDTETKPCFQKGVANSQAVSLLQLSSREKTYLFRLNKMPIPKELIAFLSSPKFIKIGVALKDDVKALKKLHSFEPQGFVDLQDLVKEFKIEDFGLKKMAAIVLGTRISKAQQLSNWEAIELNDKQIKYAATDSWISREIYIALIKSRY